MIRRAFIVCAREKCSPVSIFTKLNKNLCSFAEKCDEREVLNTLSANEFGTLKKTRDSYLKAEDLSDEYDSYDTLELTKVKRNPYYYQNKLSELVHSKPIRLQEALRVFEDMQRLDRRVPESVHFTLLISGCAKVGLTKKAFELFDMLLKSELKPTKATITALFNACAESQNRDFGIEKANFLRDWIFENSYVCNQIQFNAMVKAYAKHGQMKTAFEIIKEMIETGHATTTKTFNMLLMGCISNKVSGLLQAIKIIKQMINYQCALDVYTYNLLLRCVRECRLGSEEQLKEFVGKWISQEPIFNRSKPSSLNSVSFQVNNEHTELTSNDKNTSLVRTPNLLMSSSTSLAGQVISFNFNALTEASNRLQLIGGSKGILEHMNCYNVEPTRATFDLLLDCSPNTMEEEKDLIDLMQKHKVKPDTGFFNLVIKRRNMRNDIKSALIAVQQMQSFSLIPDIATFGVLAMGCNTKQLGLKLIEDMENAGFTLNIETVGTLMKNACMRHDFDHVVTLMNVISAKKIAVNPKLIEDIIATRIIVRDLLLKYEKKGESIHDKYKTTEFKHNFRRFNLKFEKWLKTVEIDVKSDGMQQYDYEFSKPGYHTMYLYEKLMRKKIRERIEKDNKSL